MKIERLLVVDDPAEGGRLWSFYDGVFRRVNEQTPISQSYPETNFRAFLTNGRVVKYVGREEGGDIVGLGLATDDLGLEPMLSPAYFSAHYRERPILYIVALAVRRDRRGRDIAAGILKAMINEVPQNGALVFFHSKLVNPLLPKLAISVGVANHCEGGEIDAEGCCVYRWKDGKKVKL